MPAQSPHDLPMGCAPPPPPALRHSVRRHPGAGGDMAHGVPAAVGVSPPRHHAASWNRRTGTLFPPKEFSKPRRLRRWVLPLPQVQRHCSANGASETVMVKAGFRGRPRWSVPLHPSLAISFCNRGSSLTFLGLVSHPVPFRFIVTPQPDPDWLLMASFKGTNINCRMYKDVFIFF